MILINRYHKNLFYIFVIISTTFEGVKLDIIEQFVNAFVYGGRTKIDFNQVRDVRGGQQQRRRLDIWYSYSCIYPKIYPYLSTLVLGV